MKAKRVLIVGLGHLGSSLAEELWDTHVEVTVIDKSEAAVEALKDHAAAAFVADGSDPRVLEGLGADEIDVAVVTFAEDFEACVLAVSSLSQMKVPTIIARGANERQAAVLRAVGATRVVLVEHEMGRRLAPEVLSPAASDLVEYASAFRVFPWNVPTTLAGKSLAECAFTFLPYPFCHQCIHFPGLHHGPHQRQRFSGHHKPEVVPARGKPRHTQDAHRILRKGRRYMAQDFIGDIRQATVRINQGAISVHGNGIDGQVTAQ